ncbi:hypothetical protein [Paramicrobacterium fandaimingii]|uniref:hypothetical protein n=1 Tax=Paramicrobacterium fandaimingii TaxID=2708079 RepID=UPI001420B2B1|nr:hypothetical protein [Microbacterium fandaimingii]
MNESHYDAHTPRTAAVEDSERAEAARAEQTAEGWLVPEAIQAADIDHRTSDAQALAKGGVSARARGVDWVRPSDLLARGSGHAARTAIDFHAHLAEQARTGLRAGASRLGERARRLPPVTAFGRGQVGRSGAERDAVGMS